MAKDLEYCKQVELKYAGMWFGLQCRLCGWWVNGSSPDEAIELLHAHEESHPEWRQYQVSF